MPKSRRRKTPVSLRLKKVAPALMLALLLSYLGVTNFLISDGESDEIVPQAGAQLFDDAKLAVDDAAEPGNAFSSLQQWVPIPNPSSVELEKMVSSADEYGISTTPSTADGPLAGAISVITEPPPEPDEVGSAAPESEPLTLIPTYGWVTAISADTVLNGLPIPAGSIIAAFDPNGVLIGRATVTTVGEYGAMPLYMDDPSTRIDEGATPGDLITFKINGLKTVVLGPSKPVWTENGGVLVLNLAGGGTSGEQKESGR